MAASDGWDAAQDRLAALSTNSSHRFAHVDHSGILDNPEGSAMSIQAITDVVTTVRGRSSR